MVDDWYGSLGMDRRVEQRPGEDGLGTAVAESWVSFGTVDDRKCMAV